MRRMATTKQLEQIQQNSEELNRLEPVIVTPLGIQKLATVTKGEGYYDCNNGNYAVVEVPYSE